MPPGRATSPWARTPARTLTSGSDNVAIANAGKAGESGTIRIGGTSQTATFIAGISGTTLGGATQPVVVNSAGQLGTATAAKSAADLGQLMDTVERQQHALKSQQRQIERLRKLVKGG